MRNEDQIVCDKYNESKNKNIHSSTLKYGVMALFIVLFS